MKFLIVFALAVAACANASTIPKLVQKLIPSFTTGYIIKGEDAIPHSAPYITSLSNNAQNHSHICGGTLIGKSWIVTAAHCISKPVGMSIIAGLHERTNIEHENVQARITDFGIVHHEYNGSVGPNDIALLHVSTPFELNQFVQTANLPEREELPDGETHLYGWGQPKAFTFSGAKTLQTVTTEVIEYNTCKELLPEDAPLHTSNVCSGSLGKGISACNGDSGGPLVKEHPGAPSELIGIVSWGYIPCGRGGMPSIYCRVSAFVPWIAQMQNAYYTIYKA